MSVGQVVNAQDQIDSADPGGSLSLVLYDGTYLNCDRRKPGAAKCRLPIVLPNESKPEPLLTALFHRLTNKRLPPIAFVTSRGVGPSPPVQFHDAVLTAKGATVDFSDAISAVPPSDLHLLLDPLELPESCTALDVKLARGNRSATNPVLKPSCMGLYQLSSIEDSMEAAMPATILFVPFAQFERASKLLAEATDRTSQWADATESEKRTFTRVALSAIQQVLRASK